MMAENENLLLERFVNGGDAAAFSEIVRRHSGLVYGACMRVLADGDKAADATQETFLQLLRNAADITGSIPAWLHRVATRTAFYAIRTESARRRREARYAKDKPVKTTRWQDISVYLDQGLDELDDQTRQILVQYFFEARTTTDIAAEGGISQSTVSRRIESGVTGLREKLKRRGIIVAAAALGSQLTQNAVQAAPTVVLKELGKIALAGAQAAEASAVGSAAAVSSAGAQAAVSGVLTGVKAKIITAAAVAVVVAGGIIAHKYLSREAEQPPQMPAVPGTTRPPVDGVGGGGMGMMGAIAGGEEEANLSGPEEAVSSLEQSLPDGYPAKAGGSSLADVVPASLSESLVLYYSFYTHGGGIVSDISGRANHGQVHGAEYASDDVLGQAMRFDGDEDCISIPDVYLQQFTFSGWVKTQATGWRQNNRRIFLLTDGASCYALQGNGKAVGVYVSDGLEVNEFNWRLAKDTWTYITLTHDGQTFRIYKNGKLTESSEIETSGVTGTLYIGGTDQHHGRFWHGMIDEVAIFNRALSEDEVEQLFNMTGAAADQRQQDNVATAVESAERPATWDPYGGYRRASD
jgi:RNA polymerase sigma factor (sigma-70 family)